MNSQIAVEIPTALKSNGKPIELEQTTSVTINNGDALPESINQHGKFIEVYINFSELIQQSGKDITKWTENFNVSKADSLREYITNLKMCFEAFQIVSKSQDQIGAYVDKYNVSLQRILDWSISFSKENDDKKFEAITNWLKKLDEDCENLFDEILDLSEKISGESAGFHREAKTFNEELKNYAEPVQEFRKTPVIQK